MGAHHCALGDPFLLDVVEELGSVAVGPVVDAFVGVRALDGLGLHECHSALKRAVRKPAPIVRPSLCKSGAMKHSQELGFDDEGRPVLITKAALPYEEEHRRRVRKYLTLMSFRVPALIFAAVAYNIWQNRWVSLAIIAVSVPLPWMAVLIANDRPPRRAEEPRRFDDASRRTPLFPTAEHRALDAGPAQPDTPGPNADCSE